MHRVLDAALHELAGSGYAGFRIEAVATRAAVNKTTIYRRWPTRAALIAQVVTQLGAPLRERPLPDTGRLEDDLVEAFVRRFAFARKVEGRAWARLLEERARPEVEVIIGKVVDGRRDEWRATVERAIERSELPPGTDPVLLLNFIRAIVDQRGASERLNRPWLTRVVRTIVAGARAGTLVRVQGPRPRRVASARWRGSGGRTAGP